MLYTRIFDRSGACGYGECGALAEPFYNYETIDTAWLMLTQFIAPILAAANKARGVECAAEAHVALEPIRGHLMAKGCVEAAIQDLEARLAGAPLWRHIGGERTEIACGVSVGLKDSTAELLDNISRELASGYQRVKIKIKPGQDIELVKAIRARFPSIPLMVDANSAYTLTDLELLKQFDDYDLMMVEQPLTPGDLVDHAQMQRSLRTPICLDESIETLDDARHMRELGSGKIINLKLGRVGGFT